MIIKKILRILILCQKIDFFLVFFRILGAFPDQKIEYFKIGASEEPKAIFLKEPKLNHLINVLQLVGTQT